MYLHAHRILYAQKLLQVCNIQLSNICYVAQHPERLRPMGASSVLLVSWCSWESGLLGEHHRPPVRLCPGLGGHRGAVCSDCCSNSHEEAVQASISLVCPLRWLSRAYPNVAAEPIMYCPSVRSMPFGPGPKRKMLVKPNMKPMIRPTAALVVRKRRRYVLRALVTYNHPSSHPSSLHYIVLAVAFENARHGRTRTLVKGRGAMGTASRHSSDRYGHGCWIF
jgi:hypothetical protein